VMQWPKKWQLIKRLKGNVTATLAVYDGRKRRYIPVNPNEIVAVDV